MTGTAVVVPYTLHHHPFPEPSRKVGLLDEWKDLVENTRWENIIRLSVEDAKKPVDRLIEFIARYSDYFMIEVRPVSEDPIKDHLEPHYTILNKLVHDRSINAREAVRLAEYIYLYDSVLPNLAETIVKPKEDEKYKIKIMNIPKKLFDWMFTLDYVWEKLTKRKVLDRNHFIYLDKNKSNFLREAIEMKVFLPIPPKELSETTSNPEILWFRKYHVDWNTVHSYLYNNVISKLDYE